MATADATAHRPTRVFELERPMQPVQWAAITGSLVVGLWSIAGLIANPDFTIGDGATSVRVLGVDMNGWHAVSGLPLLAAGLVAALRPSWSALFNLGSAFALIVTGVWALNATQVAGGLFYFPHGDADALLHFGTSAIFLAGAAHYYLVAQRRT
jgi:Domain of unknown function (DUF4383)